MVSVLLFVQFGGFTLTKEQIPDYFIWLYWLNPMAWGVRALAVNQYSDSKFDTCVFNGVDYCANFNMTMGEYSLTTFEVPTEKFWLWYGIAFMAATYAFFMFLSYLALEFHRYESPGNVILESDNKDGASVDENPMWIPNE